ncbi:catalase-related domain-containing protein [Nocardioides sp.]|uniref:catalase-related domain-containing protein n=1 Tax=Nocardioides sp. TaxID=35761 RepID=UPI0025F367E6|nr:catalase-related domain-containing protein [Nocardioides sp.]
MAGDPQGAFVDNPVKVPETVKQRAQPASFDDHFSQARLFWLSMTPVEKQHIIAAYSFELGKVYEPAIRERQLQCLANIDADLCEGVATSLGLPVPSPTIELADPEPSPALSMLGGSYPPDGRVVGIVAGPESASDQIDGVRTALSGSGITPLLIAPTGAPVGGELPVQRTFATARSVEYDALVLADGAGAIDSDPHLLLLIEEIFRHGKALLAWGDGGEAVATAGIAVPAPGVKSLKSGAEVAAELPDLLAAHRSWERFALS